MYRRLDKAKAIAVCIASTCLLAACAGEPAIQQGDDAEVLMGTLNRVDNAQFDFAYVDPTIDYQRYARVLLQPLELTHVEIRQPDFTSATLSRRDEWELSEEDRETLQGIYREYTERAINSSSALSLAGEGGPDVIIVEATLTEIAPTAPKDDLYSRGAGRTRIYTDGAGTVSIAIALRDGRNGEVLALIKDTRGSETSAWQLNNRVSNMAELRRIFSRWGENLAGGLERLRARDATAP